MGNSVSCPLRRRNKPVGNEGEVANEGAVGNEGEMANEGEVANEDEMGNKGGVEAGYVFWGQSSESSLPPAVRML